MIVWCNRAGQGIATTYNVKNCLLDQQGYSTLVLNNTCSAFTYQGVPFGSVLVRCESAGFPSHSCFMSAVLGPFLVTVLLLQQALL